MQISTAMWCRFALISLLVHLLHGEPRDWKCQKPTIEVTVSPLVTTDTIRSLVVYWSLETVVPGDHVALYLNHEFDDPVFMVNITASRGWVDTGTQENNSVSTSLTFSEHCVGYWAALRSGLDGHVLASSCLQTSPRWMEKHFDTLKDLSLKKMFLPGTHNSAAYLTSDAPFHETVVEKYTFNQDVSVLDQLIYGARVLDLRLAYYPEYSDSWWANHGVVRLKPLQEILEEIIIFVNNTKEIVVLDIHRFPVGFDTDPELKHQALIQYLEEILGEHLVNASLGWDAPLSEIWKSGRQLILAYNYQSDFPSQYTWPGVSQKWAEARYTDELYLYLGKAIERNYSSAWSSMAELTPTFSDMVWGHLGSLREMASRVNYNLTVWFDSEWGSKCNIVSVDFLRSTTVVKLAIKWNLRRARKELCEQT